VSDFSLSFARAHGEALGRADFKCEPEDFIVIEMLEASDFSGTGGHVCWQIRKRGQNTRWVAATLAAAMNVAEKDVGFCGMKDRRALTTQWFSVARSDQQVIPELGIPECEILQYTRHQRKLRRGGHAGNRFVIRLRNIRPNVGQNAVQNAIEARLHNIAQQGVPNYFGDQRFGFGGQNLAEADRLLQRRQGTSGQAERAPGKKGGQQGIYVSAARSYLFNRVLSARVREQTWSQVYAGEASPQGPLWGRGRSCAQGNLAALENSALLDYQLWRDALEHFGLKQERRDLILRPQDFQWSWVEKDLCLRFNLPVGSYATSLLRELFDVHTPQPLAML